MLIDTLVSNNTAVELLKSRGIGIGPVATNGHTIYLPVTKNGQETPITLVLDVTGEWRVTSSNEI